MVTALLLACTAQVSFVPVRPPEQIDTMIAVPAEGRDFIVFDGAILKLTKAASDAYGFNQWVGDRLITGSYDFSSGGLIISEVFENPTRFEAERHRLIKASCGKAGEKQIAAVLLTCTGPLQSQYTIALPPANGKQFIVYDGRFLRLIPTRDSVYIFGWNTDWKRLIGFFDFASNKLTVEVPPNDTRALELLNPLKRVPRMAASSCTSAGSGATLQQNDAE
jgi:hypothetical protein